MELEAEVDQAIDTTAAPCAEGPLSFQFSACLPTLHHALGNTLYTKVPNGLRKDISTFMSTDGFKRLRSQLYCITNDLPTLVFSAFCLSSEAGYDPSWPVPAACQ